MVMSILNIFYNNLGHWAIYMDVSQYEETGLLNLTAGAW